MSPFFTVEGRARYLPTVFLVCVAAVVVAIRTPLGILGYKSDAVLAVVVPIAGTLVALALPAAQLAQSVLESFLSSAHDLIKMNKPVSGIVTYLEKAAKERRRDLDATKWVIYYGLASLLIGLAGISGAFFDYQIHPTLAAKDLIASLATSFLVASVLWFLPVVRSSFDFTKANKLIELLRSAPGPATAPAVSAAVSPAAPVQTAVPPPSAAALPPVNP